MRGAEGYFDRLFEFGLGCTLDAIGLMVEARARRGAVADLEGLPHRRGSG